MRIAVDPRKTKVIEMRDGTRYRVGRGGHINLTPDHSAEVAKYGQTDVAETGYLSPRIGYMPLTGRDCACGRTNWPWQTVCARCGIAL